MEPVERAIRWILLCGIALSVALMAAGLALSVARGAGLPRGVVPLAELPRGLAALRPAAYLSLGLIVLIGTPFVRVAGSLVVFVRASVPLPFCNVPLKAVVADWFSVIVASEALLLVSVPPVPLRPATVGL